MENAHRSVLGIVVAGVVLTCGLGGQGLAAGDAAREKLGAAVAPFTLPMKGKSKALARLGSYIVNGSGGCNECHTCPSYAPGHNPYTGGDGALNTTNYLAGGVPFGALSSENITPDENGLPAGLTFEEFTSLMRTGGDPHEPGEIVQVMPWPVYRYMTDKDLRAVYTYLSSLPHAEAGTCSGRGE
jgi:hypothetical protein